MGTSLKRRRALGACSAALLVAALGIPAAAAGAPVPLAQIGSGGTGAGKLTVPRGVAIDGSGNLIVADSQNHRISVFRASGAFIRAFGFGVNTGAAAFEVCSKASTCQAGIAGAGAGQLDEPRGIALDGSGNLYVGETFYSRISVFNVSNPTAPSFIRAFGFGVDTGAPALEVCTAASGCQGGINGGEAGQLSNPYAVALDGSGKLYVSSSARINVFSTAGAFIHAFGWDVIPGGFAGFEVCTAVTTCNDTPPGGGDAGGGAGQFAQARGLAFDGSGNLYVTDFGIYRISVFNPAVPSFTRAFGWDVIPGGFAGFEVCTTATTCKLGGQGGGAGQLSGPLGAVPDGSGFLHIAEAFNHRISVFSGAGTAPSFTRAYGFGVSTGAGAFEVCPDAGGCQTGIQGGTGPGQLSGPFGVALDCRGALWVGDSGNSRLQRFGEPGTPPCPQQKCGGKRATIVGTGGRDVIRGTPRTDVIALLGGNDSARGLAGNDLLCGGEGRDRLIGGGGRDRLIGGAGRDLCVGGPRRDSARSCELRRTI
jgi:DNA-binding beta-propeller fold protein YncE